LCIASDQHRPSDNIRDAKLIEHALRLGSQTASRIQVHERARDTRLFVEAVAGDVVMEKQPSDGARASAASSQQGEESASAREDTVFPHLSVHSESSAHIGAIGARRRREEGGPGVRVAAGSLAEQAQRVGGASAMEEGGNEVVADIGEAIDAEDAEGEMDLPEEGEQGAAMAGELGRRPWERLQEAKEVVDIAHQSYGGAPHQRALLRLPCASRAA
jgi:hypothetical protein